MTRTSARTWMAFAAVVLAAGSLSDRFGRKGALVTGLAIFGIGTAARSLATSTGQLIGARGVMGIGGGAGAARAGVMPRSWATSATGRPASTRSSTRRRNSAGQSRLPMSSS
jgi:MFS family permease